MSNDYRYIDSDYIYNRYMQGTIDGNIEQLHQFIYEIITANK